MSHPSDKITFDNLDALFTYHRPSPEMQVKFDAISVASRRLAHVILEVCPDCAGRDAVLAEVVKIRMAANATIACDPANGGT